MQGTDPDQKIEKAKETLKTFEEYLTTLDASSWVAGGATISLADIFIHFSLAYLDFGGLDLADYPKACALNTKIEAYLKEYQKDDGLFDRARESVKAIMTKMKEANKEKMAQ